MTGGHSKPSVRLVVVPADATGDPTHGYTIGMGERFGHPELLLVGLEAARVSEFLTRTVALVASGRRVFAHGQRVEAAGGADGAGAGADGADGIFPGAPAELRRVGEQHLAEYLPVALAHYQTSEFAVLQIVFPDRHGRFPWEPGADLRMRLVQPVLDGKFRKCRWTCG